MTTNSFYIKLKDTELGAQISSQTVIRSIVSWLRRIDVAHGCFEVLKNNSTAASGGNSLAV